MIWLLEHFDGLAVWFFLTVTVVALLVAYNVLKSRRSAASQAPSISGQGFIPLSQQEPNDEGRPLDGPPSYAGLNEPDDGRNDSLAKSGNRGAADMV